MGWHNYTSDTSEDLINFMDENSIQLAKVVLINQDLLGKWHIIYKD